MNEIILNTRSRKRRAHRGKAPRRAPRARGIGCGLLAAHFDFAAHTARLDLPAGHCVDMAGCIQFCRSVDPGVIAIATLSGDQIDRRYRKGAAGWQAFGPPRAVLGVH